MPRRSNWRCPIYGDRMLGLAVSILGDRSAAEDAVQDVMIRIWRALPQFRGDASISTWIYSITRNRCLTVLKQRRGGADFAGRSRIARGRRERGGRATARQ